MVCRFDRWCCAEGPLERAEWSVFVGLNVGFERVFFYGREMFGVVLVERVEVRGDAFVEPSLGPRRGCKVFSKSPIGGILS